MAKVTSIVIFLGCMAYFPQTEAATISLAASDDCKAVEAWFTLPDSVREKTLRLMSDSELREFETKARKCQEAYEKLGDVTKADAAAFVKAKDAAEAAATAQRNADIAKFNFAIGLGLIFLSDPDVRSAVIDTGSGLVRVTEEEKYKLGLWLSTNTFFHTFESTQIRLGMFLGAQVGGDDNILNAFATGFSFAPAKGALKGLEGESPLVLQIGYGWSRVQTLVDGYGDGETPPAGSTQPLLKKTVKGGPVLLISYTFK